MGDASASQKSSGTTTGRCRRGPTSSCCPAASPTATICAAAPSPPGRTSWTPSASIPQRGGLTLGICNGFQILCEAGLLPGVLLRNAGQRFICRFQHLRVENDATRFSQSYRKGEVIKVAIAHGEGNYFADAATIDALERSGRVAFRYCDENGAVGGAGNPNGSINDIAGIYNENFNVLGLMPHPENLIDPLSRRRRRARPVRFPCGGRLIFDNSMNFRSPVDPAYNAIRKM